ncbi:uncharacterized protein LOC133528694 [Cydia pomonella]|uniref:uncharacterized protein LOC133528694 n=1 Tax=Cydia pomonella TaxID=82600 RepID=UPI002ADE2AB6|nr:uncharacterized protein LOC133528694 [Cydia pomonella]
MAMKKKLEELRTVLEKIKYVREGINVTETTLSKMCLSPQEKQCAANVQNEKVLAATAKVDNIHTKLSELEEQMKAELNNIKRPEFTSPKFRHPLNFLEDLTDYLEDIPSEYRTVENIVDCLQGDAYSWAIIFKERWSNIEDFKKDFLEYYWGHAEQSLLRREIVCGVWDSKRETMAEHFTRLEAQAKLLTRKIADEDLIFDIMSHFSEIVLSKWQVSRQRTISAAVAFLQQMDNELPDKCKSTKPKIRQPISDDNVIDLNDTDEDYDDIDDAPMVRFNEQHNKHIVSSIEQCEKLVKETVIIPTQLTEKSKEALSQSSGNQIININAQKPVWEKMWTNWP